MKLDARPPKRGDTVDGRYRLIELLGEGAAGAVWKATQISVDRTVAIKFLRDPHRDRFAARFATEATAIAQLNHPNCVTLFDYGYSVRHGTFFIVLELVEGRPMIEALRDQTLPLTQRVRIVCDVARALKHAHEQGILHRDLKPENVCLARGEGGKEVVKVLDFGLARIVDRAAADTSDPEIPVKRRRGSRITAHGEAYGTPAFMSPEQCLGNLDVGPPSDVYSLGVMLAEFVQGRLPVRGATIRELLQNHVSGSPEIDDSVPLDLQAILHRMLAKDPAKRPSPAEIVERLQNWLADHDADASDSAPRLRTRTRPGPTLVGPIEPSTPATSAAAAESPEIRFSLLVPATPSRQMAAAFAAVTLLILLGGLVTGADDAVAQAPDVRPAAKIFGPLSDATAAVAATPPADPVVVETAVAAPPEPTTAFPEAAAADLEEPTHEPVRRPVRATEPVRTKSTSAAAPAPQLSRNFEEIRLKL